METLTSPQNPLSIENILSELQRREWALESFQGYVRYQLPEYYWSHFSIKVCEAVDQFLADVLARKRPVLVLQAPPQHGKSELISRLLPAYIVSKFPEWRTVGTSYGQEVANDMSKDVKGYVRSDANKRLFPEDESIARKTFKLIDRANAFTSPYSRMGKGGYYGVGIGGALTSKRWDIGIIDDPTKDSEQALNPNNTEKVMHWYKSTFFTRRSKYSGQLIIATCWGEQDPVNHIIELHKDNPNFKHLKFPAINLPDEEGYQKDLPQGALVPDLHPFDELQETKNIVSQYWWACMYQQAPMPMNGAIFKKAFVQYYRTHELPKMLAKILHSWDMSFKETKHSDWVVGQVWAKVGTRNFLLAQHRERMSFTKTCDAVQSLWKAFPRGQVLVEEKANGAAVLDQLKKIVPNMIPENPKESKEARAHAVTPVWESYNVFLPHPDEAPWVEGLVKRILVFDGKPGGVDDEIDAMTQALKKLNPYFGGLKVGKATVDRLKAEFVRKELRK